MNDISIEQIRPEVTWRLRQQVLYPEQTWQQMMMDEDKDGYHFGVFRNDRLAAVVSLFIKENDCQFRKFAVEPSVQHMGIGTKLLQYITGFAINEGCHRLWCNARLTAVPFYLKNGFANTGNFFSKNGFDYEVLEKNLAQ